MKKIQILLLLAFLVLPFVSFARQGGDDNFPQNRGKDRIQQLKAQYDDSRGLVCREFRQEARTQINEDRDTIEKNRTVFYETYGNLHQFFETTLESEMNTIKTLINDTKKSNDILREQAFVAYKTDRDSSHISDTHKTIINNWETTLNILKQYVDTGEETIFTTWSNTYLDVLAQNKDLRLDNVETRNNAHHACYDKKSEKVIKR